MRTAIWLGLGCALVALPLSAGPVRFRSLELPPAIAGNRYDATVETIVDGRCLSGGGVALTMVGGRLPRGLELRGQELSGIPRETGTFRVAIRAATDCGETAAEFDVMVTGKPILRTQPVELVFEYHAGDPLPAAQTVLVSSTWSNLPYGVRAGEEKWLSCRQAQGATPDPAAAVTADTVAVRVAPEGLAPGVYRSTLTFSTWLGANTPEIPVVLRVTK
jgi:hypothetical protein